MLLRAMDESDSELVVNPYVFDTERWLEDESGSTVVVWHPDWTVDPRLLTEQSDVL